MGDSQEKSVVAVLGSDAVRYIAALEVKIAELKAENAALKTRVAELEPLAENWRMVERMPLGSVLAAPTPDEYAELWSDWDQNVRLGAGDTQADALCAAGLGKEDTT